MKCGSGKMGELTFEQPEEIAFFRKSKTGRPAAVIRNRAGRFCAKESGTAGKFIPVFRFCEGRDFLFSQKTVRKIIST